MFNCKLLTLNVRGINKEGKRRSIFRYVKSKCTDICFLQETYSSKDIEHIWRNQWGGHVIFSHGTKHSKGVMILIRPGFNIDMDKIVCDKTGRYILIHARISNQNVLLLNLYSPNDMGEQLEFLKEIQNILVTENETGFPMLVGGDMNLILNPDVDRKGGNFCKSTAYKKVTEVFHSIVEEWGLCDIWRLKNPNVKRFTWRQKSPAIHSRLDLWLISICMFDHCVETDILPSVRSDHSAVIMVLCNIDSLKGPGLWKLNNSFLQEELYVNELVPMFDVWKQEAAILDDKRMTWEYIKYKIREFSINYGKKKKKEMDHSEKNLEQKLKAIDEELDQNEDRDDLYLEKERITQELQNIDKYKTEGLILRTRSTWYEEGEKSTKYFLRLISRNAVKSNMTKLYTGKKFITNQKEILDKQADFYEELYRDKLDKGISDMIEYLSDVNMPELSEEDKEICNGKVTKDECYKTLLLMKTNKTPGNDGLTVEFYKRFWNELGYLMVECFNLSYDIGELSITQKQAVIVLIDKGKDRTLLKNWRPISLLNVDYKILSKTLSERLKNILSKIIHPDQTGFVYGRNIVENIRTVLDILEYTKAENIPGILINIDFEKAFDSVNWDFIKVVLEKKYKFDHTFVKWINVLYNGVSSCILNNGYTSRYFNLHRGVRQGDPMSPYIFILIAEVLACKIRQSKKIEGVKIGGHNIKVLQYADDTNGIVLNVKSAKHFLYVVEEFGTVSGLSLNKEKTQALWLGKCRNSKEKPLGIEWPDKPLRVLGVYISYDKTECELLNFEKKISKCKNIMNDWRGRNLSILGKVQVIKTFIISQFLFVTSAIAMPGAYVDVLNKLIISFIWGGGKHLLSKEILYKNKANGGLDVPEVGNLVKVSNLKWIKNFMLGVNGYWKAFLVHFLKLHKIDINILLYSNVNVKLIKGLLKVPEFYRNVLCDWVTYVQTSTRRSNFIWYNQNIIIKNAPVFYKEFYDIGICNLSDLYDEKHKLRPFEHWTKKGLSSNNWLNWCGLITSVKNVSEIKVDAKENTFVIDDRNLMECTTKELYYCVNKKGGIENVQVPRLANYVSLYNELEWKDIYMYVFNHLIDTKSKQFQYKFIHDILVNRYWLNKWKITDSNLCRLCGNDVENLLHMFWECIFTQRFWIDTNEYLYRKLNITLNKEEVFFGMNNMVSNTIIVNAKKYIYNTFVKDGKPKLEIFLHSLSHVIQIEYNIYKRKKNVSEWQRKWSPFITDEEITM